jgi:catechol 2,3-dioxygenase-like lactoylglutathione lyase family enzyme
MPAVRYLVTDVDQALSFYRDHLGFEVIERWGPAFAMVARDGLQLWLSGPQTSAAQPMPDGRTPEPGGWNRIVIEVTDLPALVARLKSNGVCFRNDIVAGPGGSQILAEDGVGNVVELFEPRA